MKNHIMIDVHCQEDKDSHIPSWGLLPWCMALQRPWARVHQRVVKVTSVVFAGGLGRI